MLIRLIFPSSRLPQLAASLISKQACNVAYWHETDMPKYLGDVRCWVNSGKHLLLLSFSGFDPQRTLAACATNYARIRFLTRAREAIRSRCAALRLPPCLASGYTIAAAILR